MSQFVQQILKNKDEQNMDFLYGKLMDELFTKKIEDAWEEHR